MSNSRKSVLLSVDIWAPTQCRPRIFLLWRNSSPETFERSFFFQVLILLLVFCRLPKRQQYRISSHTLSLPSPPNMTAEKEKVHSNEPNNKSHAACFHPHFFCGRGGNGRVEDWANPITVTSFMPRAVSARRPHFREKRGWNCEWAQAMGATGGLEHGKRKENATWGKVEGNRLACTLARVSSWRLISTGGRERGGMKRRKRKGGMGRKELGRGRGRRKRGRKGGGPEWHL